MNDFKVAKLDTLDILKDGVSGIYYTQKDWRRLSVSDASDSIDGMHGRTTSAVYARTRIITLEGFIDRIGNNEELPAVLYMENLFRLQSNPGVLERRQLYIKDIYDREWKMDVKVKEPIEILEGDESFIGSHWRWRVVLESIDDPVYRSFEEILQIGEEGIDGGFFMDFTLDFSMDATAKFIECNGEGNIESPARMEIEMLGDIISPLRIRNITNNTDFSLDITATTGDIIIVNSQNNTVTKNGVNILGNRIPGSIWPAVSGTTLFLIEDGNGGVEAGGMEVRVYFNNSLL